MFPDLISTEIKLAAAESTLKLSRRQARAANRANQDLTSEQCRKAVALCTVEPESVADYQLWKLLKPLLDLEKINKKRICNPVNFRSSPMVTTFVRLAGDRSKGVWKFLDTVCQTDTGGVGALLLKTMFAVLFREGPYFGSPLFLQVTKGAVPAGCWSVQGWPSEYWTRH